MIDTSNRLYVASFSEKDLSTFSYVVKAPKPNKSTIFDSDLSFDYATGGTSNSCTRKSLTMQMSAN